MKNQPHVRRSAWPSTTSPPSSRTSSSATPPRPSTSTSRRSTPPRRPACPGPDGKLMHAASGHQRRAGVPQRRLPRVQRWQVVDAEVARRDAGHHPPARTRRGRPVPARAGCRRDRARMPLEDQFWGDRYGMVRDPFGHQWSLAETVREVGCRRDRQYGSQGQLAGHLAITRPGSVRALWIWGPSAAAASMSATAVNLLRGRPAAAPRAISAASMACQPAASTTSGRRARTNLSSAAGRSPGSASMTGVVVGDQLLNGLRGARLVGADEPRRAALDPAGHIRAPQRYAVPGSTTRPRSLGTTAASSSNGSVGDGLAAVADRRQHQTGLDVERSSVPVTVELDALGALRSGMRCGVS